MSIELVKIVDGTPIQYGTSEFRADNKYTTYGEHVSDAHLNAQDVYRVQSGVKPDEAVGFDVVEDGFPVLTEGVWLQNYTSVAKGANDARTLRNDLLTETDWCANSDVIMSDDMTTYRQALRDITDQSGFPTNITWPTKP